jgi:puromycin-sensitive aminopeptidase
MSRLAPHTYPEKYALHVEVDPRKDHFRGEVEIELTTRKGQRTLELHAVDLEFREVELRDARGPVQISRQQLNPRKETLSLRLDRGLAGPRASLRLAYRGPLRADLRGLYLARSGKRRYAVTQLEAADARRFFPCFDEPDKKARFAISVTTPRGNQVLSNAPVTREISRGQRKTVEFAETARLSTYLIALIVGELEGSAVRRCGPTPIRVWTVPGKRQLTSFALEAAVESLSRLEKYFGLPYPYQKLDLIAVPDFEFGAMENAGAVTFRENLLLADPKTITLGEKKRIAEVMAHELAHMWYGDLVTMAWWDDLWLNEAFATWMAFTIVDDWRPEWQMWLDFEAGRSAAFDLDALSNTHPIYVPVATPDEATENFDLITYEKGAAVVRMIERWLGRSKFRKGVRSYIRRHREGNARASDLWSALQEASGVAVEPVVRDWIEKPGFPLVSVRRQDRAGAAALVFEQERYSADPRAAKSQQGMRWHIPAVIRVKPSRGRSRPIAALISKRRQRLEIGSSHQVRWAYANCDESGFYRPLHRAALLRALGDGLEELEAVERLGLIGHQWAGVRAGLEELAEFLDLVDAFWAESQPEVLRALTGPLQWLSSQLLPGLASAEAELFRAWLGGRFGPEFAGLGWSPRPREDDQTRLRRAALLQLAGGIAEDPQVLAETAERARAYLAERSSLDPNLAGPTLELAARGGGKKLYQAYLRCMRRAATPQERSRFQLALGAFRDPGLIEHTLELVLTRTVPTQDVVIVLMRLLANPSARDATWSFISGRWEELEPRMTTGLVSRLIGALPELQTRAQRRQVVAFFREHPFPSAARTLKQALERFDLNAALRQRTTPELKRWLAERS